MDHDPQLTERWLEIHAEIEALRRKAKAAAIMQIELLMTQYGISPGELKGGDGAPAHRKPKARYWNPETGQTWSGRGRMPKWLVGRELASHLIDGESALKRMKLLNRDAQGADEG